MAVDLGERSPAKWRIGKPFDVGWAVFTVDKLGEHEIRTVVQRFGTFEDARAAFSAGDTTPQG